MRQHLMILFLAYCFCAIADRYQLFAAEPEPITSAETLPESTPWNLKKLSQPPKFEWAEGTAVRALYYQGLEHNGKPTRVFAYYATPGTLAGDPSEDQNLPTMVLVHGGGGSAFSKWVRLWASRGYAAIAMDLAGNGPDKKRLTDGGPGQGHDMKFGQIDKPVTEQWTYHAVANVILAHSLARSFPEVDADRTAVTGISWGGYLTCIVAGLDNRFKAAVPVYGCGFLHENSVWLNDFARMTDEHRDRWVKLWDPSSYAGSTQMPVLYVNGGRDFAYPPDSHAKTYGLVKSSKNLYFYPELAHGHIFDKPKCIEVFIESQLKGKTPLAKITKVEAAGKNVIATVESKTKLVNAMLHYTADELPGNNKTRKWLPHVGTIDGDKVTVKRAPEESTIWFVTVSDERGTTVSSELQFAK